MRKKLEAELEFLKADYMRIQEDLDKISSVNGNLASAEEQLIRLENKMAQKREEIAAVDS